ncbi:hypothetical protein [Candidatus Berkiella aquae]|uniref:Uncharacterized protein n=1 Tax=Candidatus Berkiella aquae TaxID=295108 RepID=A0A0Q9YPF8_9GAMM|nr:hypothetical protein [Candidatus Berkiella aquae]MCS5710618.1 hypothetical protein [Candidatus Berkiella aquae]
MKKVVILPLSLFIDNQQERAKEAFIRLGINRFSLLWHFFPLPSFLERFRGPSLSHLFDQYRSGRLNTRAFRDAIRGKFPNVSISDADFDTAWNSMQIVTDVTKNALKEARALEKQGFEINLILGSNPLHLADIKRKTGMRTLPGKGYWSFVKNKLGRNLFTSLLDEIKSKNPGIQKENIAYFYSVPQDPYPRLGILAWLYDPIRKYEYFQAKRYVAQLQEAARTNGFSLVEFKREDYQNVNIKKSIERLGWLKNKVLDKAKDKPAITHSYRSRKPSQAQAKRIATVEAKQQAKKRHRAR